MKEKDIFCKQEKKPEKNIAKLLYERCYVPREMVKIGSAI